MTIKFYNTLTHKKEEFKPIKKNSVGIYSCGPTVYWDQHIGHIYAYTQFDTMIRFLRYVGYEVTWVMNITDVGHLTSDEDEGEDKMEKGAQREGISVMEIAEKYIARFKESLVMMNIVNPDIMCRATEHISEQIELAKKIKENGFTYKTNRGLIFDTAKFPGYADFARLRLEKQREGTRIEIDKDKKNPSDFFLWMTDQPHHTLQWDSPWGKGFPGWHIECTAMSTKYLGEKFDIHTGGKDHIPGHHTNEIAQAYGAFGTQTANYWLHNGMLKSKDKKISKSDPSSIILVSDLKDKGYNPLSFRYLVLTSHYRQGLEFSWESLSASQTALNRLYESAKQFSNSPIKSPQPPFPKEKQKLWQDKFVSALANDLNTAQALAVVWQMIKDKDTGDKEKLYLLLDWDIVLGLKIKESLTEKPEEEIPEEIEKIIKEREITREKKEWKKSDELRDKIKDLGWEVKDTEKGQEINKLT